MVEDREEVRVATRTYEALPVACVRGSTTILATPEELLDVLLHQGDTHAAWDELYARGIVRDSLSDNVHAIRVALKHAGTAARRELHLMRTWAKVDECCAWPSPSPLFPYPPLSSPLPSLSLTPRDRRDHHAEHPVHAASEPRQARVCR